MSCEVKAASSALGCDFGAPSSFRSGPPWATQVEAPYWFGGGTATVKLGRRGRNRGNDDQLKVACQKLIDSPAGSAQREDPSRVG